MRSVFSGYKNVEKHIFYLILAECCVQLINAAFIFVLLVYMQKQGYSDYEGASFTKFRFLSILLLAFPVGIYIRGRKIKPLFTISCFIVPVSSLLIIYGVEKKTDWLIYLSQFTWGIGFVGIQIAALPFILRNSKKETITEGISLSHSTWSIAGVVSGILIFGLQSVNTSIFSERNLLIALALAGFAGLYFVNRIQITENLNDPENHSEKKSYEWNLIIKAMIPTTLIAVGAGLTIPFISLFFYNVHGLDAFRFSIFGALALSLVFIGTMAVPHIKNRLGYKKAVPVTQSLAIIALIALALTEYSGGTAWGLSLALFFYAIRQPLMNMAAPMTSEVTMMYAGKKNQEMVSALTASIWSGGWFISSYVFEKLRESSVSYMNVFLITAFLYSIGVVAYMLLIRDYEKRKMISGQ